MKKNWFFYIIFIVVWSFFINSQEEVRIRITDGMPMIPVAMPEIAYSKTSVKNDPVRDEIYQTLWNDLVYSRVFQLIPREHYSYIQKYDPEQINFKDWASIQANILLSMVLDISADNRIILSIKAFEVNSEKLIFGRNLGGKPDFVRLLAHKTADEMMKYFGEKPIFTSKVVYVSDRDGNKEIYMMDYDGKREKRITFNSSIDILPSWSWDNERILYTSYRRNSPDLYLFNLYSGKMDLVSTKGVNYSADWLPEGDKIVFTSSKNGNTDIYSRDMKTGQEKTNYFQSRNRYHTLLESQWARNRFCFSEKWYPSYLHHERRWHQCSKNNFWGRSF